MNRPQEISRGSLPLKAGSGYSYHGLKFLECTFLISLHVYISVLPIYLHIDACSQTYVRGLTALIPALLELEEDSIFRTLYVL